ncbi:MAG: diguanylate cyclase [bacterium]
MIPIHAADAPPSMAERYRVLLDIGRTLTGTLSGEEELYTAIYRETARVMEVDGFYVSTYDAEEDLARVVFWADRGEGRHASITYRGSESEVIRSGRPSMIGDALETRSLLVIGDTDSPVTRAAISAPLRSRGRVLGVISAQSYNPDAYSDSDLELLQGIADVAAVAMENVRHVQELEHRRREAERMEEISRVLASSLDAEAVLNRVVEAALDLLEADGAYVWLAEGGIGRVGASHGHIAPPSGATFPVEGEPLSRLMHDGRFLLLDRLPEQEGLPDVLRPGPARNALMVPLRGPDRVIGALGGVAVRDQRFRSDDARLLQRLAGHAAVALENARLHQALQTLSLTDPLTGLPNRRQLEVHLSREFAAAERGRPLALVLFDVDRFKEFNDTQGHVAGDQALRAVARVLEEETRAMNLVARYGGDEFLAVLSDTDEDGARQHARRVHRRAARDAELGPMGITLSSGVAAYRDGMERMEDLIREADYDMYRAKASSRRARERPEEEPREPGG